MRRLRPMLPLLTAVALTAGAAACSGPADPVAAPASSAGSPGVPRLTTSLTASPSESPAGPAILNFTAKTLTGSEFDGTTVAGKPAVLWFWTPTCVTCAQQAKGVKATAEKLAGKVTVVGVAGKDDEATMRRVAGTRKLDGIPHMSDQDGTLTTRFSAAESTFVLLDSEGNVNHIGTFSGDLLLSRAGGLA